MVGGKFVPPPHYRFLKFHEAIYLLAFGCTTLKLGQFPNCKALHPAMSIDICLLVSFQNFKPMNGSTAPKSASKHLDV